MIEVNFIDESLLPGLIILDIVLLLVDLSVGIPQHKPLLDLFIE